jgi:glycosyltransferase involved in cell wall biosynthesis
MGTKYKVVLIHNIISPYRVPLFEGLSNHPSIDLTVYFCAKTHKHRKWDVLESEDYKYEILSGTTLEFSGITYHINPSIVSRLINGKYDAVILSGNPDFTTHIAFLTCKLLKIPFIWWSEGIETSQSTLGKLISPFTKYIIRSSASVVVPGILAKKFHMKLGAASEKIFFAPNIVDNDLFIKKSSTFKQNIVSIKQELNLPNKKIILYVGRLIEAKGLLYLLESYKKLKLEYNDICLVFVGNGSFKDKLENLCVEENINDVIFTGWLSDERIKYYSIADIFVFPTLRDVWGLVINEAMCCGLPVVSTKAAGSSIDMIKPGENGFIVDAEDVNHLYFAMKEITSNKELANKMGDMGELRSKKCDCGREYPLFERVEGRSQDIIITRDNSRITLTALIFGQHFNAFSHIKELQLVQEQKGELTFKIVKSDKFNTGDEKEILEKIKGISHGQIDLDFLYVDSIPKTERGKHRFLIQKSSDL